MANSLLVGLRAVAFALLVSFNLFLVPQVGAFSSAAGGSILLEQPPLVRRNQLSAAKNYDNLSSDTTTTTKTAAPDSASGGRSSRKDGILEQQDGSRSAEDEGDTATVPLRRLWTLLSETPAHEATPQSLTREILTQIRVLEESCPTDDRQVIDKLAGTWELVWTSQDETSPEANQGWWSWIGPLENQSYSNHGGDGGRGQSNPVLPLVIQQGLEAAGILPNKQNNNNNNPNRPAAVSTQTIDLEKQLATNVVTLRLWDRFTMSITVQIGIQRHATDARRVNVRFWSSQFKIPSLNMNNSNRNNNLEWNIPLNGFPRGWLRTTYIDDTVRITRGHKGSVFVLKRPGRWFRRNL